MPDLDPDAVQVFAAQLHAVECLPGAVATARWAATHHKAHETYARIFLSGLAEAGYHLTTKEP